MTASTTKIAVALVIALKEEFKHLERGAGLIFTGHESRGTETYHHFTFLDQQRSSRSGIALFLDDVGIPKARVATDRLVRSLRPSLVVSLGISGMLSDDLRIGDVFVPRNVHEYSKRMKATGDSVKFGGDGYPADSELVELLTKAEFTQSAAYLDWQTECKERLNSQLLHRDFKALVSARLLRDAPELSTGIGAAGEFVIKSATFKTRLRETNVNFMACDMESAGVLAAVFDQPGKTRPRALVIRGISDPSDERKTDLESIKDGLLRQWSVTNAYRILEFLLRTMDFGSPTRRGVAKPTRTETVAQLASELHAVVNELYLVHKPLAELPIGKDPLALYAQLFRHLIHFQGSKEMVGSPFDAARHKILNSANSTPLQVEGPPGSGKSLFLALLYRRLHRDREIDDRAPIPFLVDLARYDEAVYDGPATELRNQALRLVAEDVSPLRKLLQLYPDQKIVVIIDGFREYRAFQKVAESYILRLCETHPSVQKIVAVRIDGPQENLEARWDPEEVITLSCVSTDDADDFQCLLEDYLETAPQLKVTAAQLVKKAKDFRLAEIDLFTIALLASKASAISFTKVNSLSQFYKLLCEEYLHMRDQEGTFGRETLNGAADLAFRVAIEKRPIPAERLQKRSAAWSLMHQHSNIRDFLVAWHLVNEIVLYAERKKRQPSSALTYVFPAQITRFIKEIVNLSGTTQKHVLVAAEKASQTASLRTQTVLSYLLGRFEQTSYAARALGWLETQQVRAVTDLVSKGKDGMLLARTIYISLVYLGSNEASAAYISKLLADPSWDNVNRGFHLEYYGDMPYDPGSPQPLSNEDMLEPFPRTFSQLLGRLRRSVEKRAYRLFDIELHTLCSLALHRHARGRLADPERHLLLGLLSEVITTGRVVDGEFLQYLRTAQEHLQLPRFRIGRYAEELNAMKTNKRTGWLRRGLDNVESIADHSYGAYLLGLLYLPDGSPEPGYDKQRILNMLLTHDLAEAFTGDIPANERREESVREEREWFTRLAQLSTYDGMPNLRDVKELWEDFERGAETNAIIARDLDRLENLVQLHIYSSKYTIKDSESWAAELRKDVRSAEGRRILDVVDKHFVGDDI